MGSSRSLLAGPLLAAAVLTAACSATSAGGRTAETSLPATASTSPQSQSAAASSTAAADQGWLTYHQSASRTGADPTSPPLSSPALGWRSPALDGPIWAEPLVDGGHVLVATEGGSVYALDGRTGGVVWRTHVDDPISLSRLPCGDVSPLGITGTPVVDPATQTIFVAAERSDGSHELAALSVSDGSILWRRVIDAPGTVPLDQQQRAALALAGGRVVVALGGLDGDCGTYRGYVVSVSEDGAGAIDTYTVPVINRAGIWAPSGPAVAASGDILVATGNSQPGGSFDFSNSVIALDSSLHEVGYFAPTDWRLLSEDDLDLGSTGPMLDGGSVLVAGKDGILYLLRAGALGGIGGQVTEVSLGSGAFGGLALDGQTVLVPTQTHLDAVTLQGDSLQLSWRGPATWPPIVAGGAVWAVTRGGADLVALSPAGGGQLFSYPLGAVENFTTPAASDGWVYVGAGTQVVGIDGA